MDMGRGRYDSLPIDCFIHMPYENKISIIQIHQNHASGSPYPVPRIPAELG